MQSPKKNKAYKATVEFPAGIPEAAQAIAGDRALSLLSMLHGRFAARRHELASGIVLGGKIEGLLEGDHA